MRLGILSDTHDELDRTRRAIQLLRDAGAEALVHCGDLTSACIVEACAVLPCWFVFGNHDADSVPALQEKATQLGVVCLGWSGEVEFHTRRIAVAHGHMSYDIRRALKSRPHYLLSGHSHIAGDIQVGLVRRINPGALCDADQFTVALLDVECDEVQFVPVPA